MNIISRKDAVASNMGQYFTGKPCKRGHISPRYVQSGACAMCVSESSKATRAMIGAQSRNSVRADLNARVHVEYLQKRDAINDLVEIRVPIHQKDVKTVADLATYFCIARYPFLEPRDFTPVKPLMSELPLHKVRIPAEDVYGMREAADALFSTIKPDFSDVHRKRREYMADVERGKKQAIN